MTSIISGQVSTSAAISRVLAGTPTATSPTIRAASVIAYKPHGGRFMMAFSPPAYRFTMRRDTGEGYGLRTPVKGAKVPTPWGYGEDDG
jgi:hypothetical protein